MLNFFRRMFWLKGNNQVPTGVLNLGQKAPANEVDSQPNNELVFAPPRLGKTRLDEKLAMQALEAGATFVVANDRQAECLTALAKKTKDS